VLEQRSQYLNRIIPRAIIHGGAILAAAAGRLVGAKQIVSFTPLNASLAVYLLTFLALLERNTSMLDRKQWLSADSCVHAFDEHYHSTMEFSKWIESLHR
jgi:hypothetical protein